MQLGWIDFSKTERSKILSVLDLLSEAGTLDELGIAPIRDGFSNMFFPGTSTIQTRAKYFMVVPYALKQLERSGETNPNKILKSLDEIERACGEVFLRNNHDENGIIGKRSLQNGKWVKRTPADIYWAGLRQYGIFTGGKLSLGEYVRVSCALKSQKNTLNKLGNRNDNAEENECDDKNAGNLFNMQFWKLPIYRETWMNELQMELTDEEAQFLGNQIVENCDGSMLSYVLKNNMLEFLECDSFQGIEMIIDKFPKDVQDTYAMAIAFSNFMYAIRTIYNVIISDGKNEIANRELEWQKKRLPEIAALDIDAIMERVGVFNNPLLRKFLKQAQECMLDENIDGLKKCIISREIQLKGMSRAKTAHPGEFNPDEWLGGGALDYRFYNARTLLRDIMMEEEKDA